MRFAPFLASVLLLSACGRKDAVSQPVRIVALLPDPRGAADEHGEWVTLRNGGGRDADLAGWRLDSGGDAGFTLPRGTVLRPGESLTLARALDRRRNGGVAARVRLRGITLGNRADWLALRDASGRTVDSVAWLDAARGVEIPGRDRSPRQTARTSSAPPTPAALEIRVLNVGQGDAILIRSGSSLALIDGGPDPALLGRRLDALGIGRDTTIDVVVLTHAHADHYQGLRELFRGARRLRVRWFVENGDPSPQAALRRLRDSVGARVRRGALTMRDADDPCGDGRPTCT
ncbi:MAG TPA: lamin tail domain-containing protein, partial [Gemmatimonadaceae bacterium]|nr:lamin tail domain-containing protein [Gemmatimonadaceae bacterium]